MAEPAHVPDNEALARSIAWRTAASGLAGGVLLYLYLAVLAPDDPTERVRQESPLEEIALAAALVPLGAWAVRRAIRGALRWRGEQRPPTEQECSRLLQQSARIATATVGLWALATATVVAYNVLTGAAAMEQVHSVLAIMFGGLVNAAASFVLVERSLRPLYVVALAGRAPDDLGGVGIRTRVVLAWALGSGVPTLAIGVALLGRTASERAELTASIWFLVAVALAAGAGLTASVAGAAAQRLEAARAALARVRQGDLAVALPVDDASELGSLQAGFNEMTAGLRERERLRDLFGRHVGTEVAHRALEQGVHLGGQQRAAAALFVDLVGSTSYAEVATPAEVVELLNAFFAAVVDAVGAEGGWVNKFQGDAALAVFGAPDEQPDHCTRALAAARRLRAALVQLADAFPLADAGIGVSAGLVVAGNVGAEQRFEYTVIGDPVNEAARLTEAAKARPGRVLASGAVVEGASPEEAARWRPTGALELRGRAAPTETFEPNGGGARG